MNREQLHEYLSAQIAEIQKYKWIESERRHHDIGFAAAAFEWISHYSAQFRDYWNMTHPELKHEFEPVADKAQVEHR